MYRIQASYFHLVMITKSYDVSFIHAHGLFTRNLRMELCAYAACILFANSRSKATAGVLVNAPLIKFYKAKELLQKHSTEINFHTERCNG